MGTRSLPRGLAQAGALASVIVTANVISNLARMRTPEPAPHPLVSERVSVLVPARNEAHRIGPTLDSVLQQEGVADLEIIVLDDGSSDGTGPIIQARASLDPRVKVLDGDDTAPPAGWRGKSWACQRLAAEATGSVLVFVDADVVLQPGAVAAAVREMRALDVELVSPYPRQLAVTAMERLTQPLVTWSWIATLPLALAERTNPAWSAAIGQFLVVDTSAYRASGGHEAVAGYIVEDVEVLRAMKRHGYRGLPVNGARLAECRMYEGASDVYEGYCKSLWAVFGSTPGAVGGASAMVLIYVLPPAVMLLSRDRAARRWGAIGYASGVLGRALVARRTGERVADSLAQPASTATFAALTITSLARRRFGRLSWKGRDV